MKVTTEARYEKLVSAVQELSLTRDLESVMAIVRSVARELTGADGATFILRDDDQCYYADEDAISPLWKGHRFPLNNCISGWVMLNRQSTVISDIFQDSRIPVEAYRPTFVKSLAMVPIRTMSPIGAIGNYWASHYTPAEDEVRLLQSLADITAVTMENVSVYKELEERVRRRTAELEQANQSLSESNAELETIAYSLSHDLRSPLRNITFTLQKLVDEHHTVETDPARVLTDKMFSKISSMQVLMNDLLTLFETGKKGLQLRRTSMKELVVDLFDELKESERSRRITFEVTDLPAVNVDAVLIRQVWYNLISNAIKYTRRKANALIRVDYRDSGAEIIFCIDDNGVGFDMAYYEKMFGAFQRLHRAIDFEGTGIGLAIVEKIVSRHKGKVWAKGEPDKGATFYFSIPK